MKQKKCKIKENRREKVRKTREEKNGELRYVKESFENEKMQRKKGRQIRKKGRQIRKKGKEKVQIPAI